MSGDIVLDSKDFDLSELHMAWYIRNDPDKRFRETSILPRQLTLATIAGAGNLPAMSYLARLDGPVLEQSLPYISNARLDAMGYKEAVPNAWYDFKQYPSYELFQKLGEEAFGKNNKPLPELNQPPESFDVQLRITDVLFGAELPESRNPSTPDMWLISRDMVKELVMKHGAVAIAYHATDEGESLHDGLKYY